MLALGELGELEADLGAGRVGELEGAEQPLVVGEEAEDAAHHGPVLGHEAEGPGKGAALVEEDTDTRRRLAEQAAGQIAEAARPGEVRAGARLHDRAEDVVEELGVRRDGHSSVSRMRASSTCSWLRPVA